MNTIKKSISTVITTLTFITSFAQSNKYNNVYVELLGNAVGYSVNYDRIIPLSDKIKLAPRVGFEYIPRKLDEYPTYGKWSFPLELNMLYGKTKESKFFFEGGLGLSLFNIVDKFKTDDNGKIFDTDVKMAKVTLLRLGIRHQKPTRGLMYRAGLLIRLNQDEFSKSRVSDDLFYKLWPGFSIGYTF